jgi:hypothetical protein
LCDSDVPGVCLVVSAFLFRVDGKGSGVILSLNLFPGRLSKPPEHEPSAKHSLDICNHAFNV